MFIEHCLTAPQELYLQEGLDWDPIRIPDNRGTVMLFTDLQPACLIDVSICFKMWGGGGMGYQNVLKGRGSGVPEYVEGGVGKWNTRMC